MNCLFWQKIVLKGEAGEIKKFAKKFGRIHALRIGGAAEPLRSNGVREHGTPESLTRRERKRP